MIYMIVALALEQGVGIEEILTNMVTKGTVNYVKIKDEMFVVDTTTGNSFVNIKNYQQ